MGLAISISKHLFIFHSFVAWWGLGSTWACTSTWFSISCFQNREATHQSVVYGHQCSRIIEFSTVVWSWEYSNELSTAEEFIAILDDLVRSTNQIDVILLQELLDNSFTKCIADASIVFSPTALGLLWIRPKQVAQEAILRNFCWPSDLLQLCHGDELWWKATMHAEYLVIN